MDKYFNILLIIVSAFIDLWMFYKIVKYNKKYNVSNISLTVISYIIGCFISNINQNGSLWGDLWLLFTLYLIYRKYIKSILLLGTLFFIFDVDLVVELLGSVIIDVTPTFKYSLFLLLIIIAFLVKKYSNKIHELLVNQNGVALVFVLIYVFSSINIWAIITTTNNDFVAQYLLLTFLFVFQIIFLFFAYYEIIRIQKKLLERKEQEELKRSQHQLEEYADYLEKSEDELRAFRHDYRNMFNSLKISAREGNTQEVINLLDKYTKSNLDSQALLKYKDANHIHVKSLKSIVISKLTEMYNYKITYNFECRQVIKQIPDVNEIDLIRIIGITCDNAIEESQLMLEKGLKPEIQIMFYSNGEDEFEYEIRNKIHDKNISASQIQKKGFTTKKNHQGLGLTNIRNIESKYPDMTISHTVEDGWFDFYMMIDAEDGE